MSLDVQTDILKSLIPAYNYLDATVGYEFDDRFTLRVGANNVTGKKPPLVGGEAGTTDSNSGNTFPNTYDPLGAVFFVGLTGRI